MKSNFVWLSKSLFCSKKNWPALLNSGIKPFIKGLTKKEMERYQIRLNQTNGESIELAILTTEEGIDELNIKMEAHFGRFFQGLRTRMMQSGVEDRFMPFPQNSMQFALYGLLYEEDLLEGAYKTQELLSTIMMDNISPADMGDEAMLTFVFRLYVATIKAFIPYYHYDMGELLKAYCINSIGTSAPRVDPKHVNMAVFLLNEIVHSEKYPEGNKPNRLEPWVGACRRHMQKAGEEKAKAAGTEMERIRNIHLNLAGIIDYHFGIEIDQKEYLYTLIERASPAFDNRTNGHNGRHGNYVKGVNNDVEKLNHYLNMIRTKNIYKRMDHSPIGDCKDEIRLFVIARNESLRLPYFLEYYAKLGVDRFFLIDNNSSDKTAQIALEKNNVHVFKIEEGYRNHWYWMEYFLQEYGTNHWCMVVDVDELFCFPYSEKLSLRDLTAYLDANRYTAIKSVLVDTYSDKSIVDTVYLQNDSPLEICKYFEKNYFSAGVYFLDQKKGNRFYGHCHFGGVRSRVFGHAEFCLTKVSLFKYLSNTYLVQGMHSINGAQIADIEGAVLHTKYFQDFVVEANVESLREEHFANGFEYKIYNEHLMNNMDLVLKYDDSFQFENTNQLIEVGIMKNSGKFEAFIRREHA